MKNPPNRESDRAGEAGRLKVIRLAVFGDRHDGLQTFL
jgi:hypothetical protein